MLKPTPRAKARSANWSLPPVSKILFGLLVLLLPTQLGKHFWPDFSFILGLKVDYLSPAVYLSDLLVFGVLISWFWKTKGSFRLSVFRRQFSISFFLFFSFLLFLFITSFLSVNSGAAVYKLVKIIELLFLGIFVAKNRDVLEGIFFKLLPWAVVFEAIVVWLQFLKQESLGGFFWFLGERTFNASTPGIALAQSVFGVYLRPYGTFSHPNSLAGFFLVSLLLTLPYWFKKNRTFTIYPLLFTIPVLLFTFSRAVWFVGGLVLLFYILQSRKKVILPLLFALLSFLLASFFLARPYTQSFMERIALFRAASDIISLSPFSGVGLNNFIVYLPNFWQTNQVYLLQPVHNIFLLLTAETGLIGLAVFLWFLYLTFKKLIPIRRSADRFLIPFLSILLLGLFDHYWLTLQQNMLLGTIVIGMIWGSSGKIKR